MGISLEKLKIVIADDSPVYRRLLEAALAQKLSHSSPALKLVGGGESLLGSPFHYEREGEFFAWHELQRNRENPVVLIIFIHGSGYRLVCRRQAKGTGVFCTRRL